MVREFLPLTIRVIRGVPIPAVIPEAIVAALTLKFPNPTISTAKNLLIVSGEGGALDCAMQPVRPVLPGEVLLVVVVMWLPGIMFPGRVAPRTALGPWSRFHADRTLSRSSCCRYCRLRTTANPI